MFLVAVDFLACRRPQRTQATLFRIAHERDHGLLQRGPHERAICLLELVLLPGVYCTGMRCEHEDAVTCGTEHALDRVFDEKQVREFASAIQCHGSDVVIELGQRSETYGRGRARVEGRRHANDARGRGADIVRSLSEQREEPIREDKMAEMVNGKVTVDAVGRKIELVYSNPCGADELFTGIIIFLLFWR